ncbi:MAG: replicative DNA helicase, partial [Burkholderiaceae bacterium]
MNPFDLTDNLPWAPDAEAGVIGAILMDNTAYDHVADLITPESFFDERAGCVFAAAGQLILAGKAADVISVHDQLQSTGLLGEMTIADIHQLSLGASSARNARRYAEIVADKQMARKLLSAADEVKIIAADLQIPTSDRIGQAQAKIEALQDRVQKSKPLPIQHYIAGALDRIQDLADGKTQPGIPTRIPALDRALGGGLKGGKQMILAARPSVGKSSLAEQIALNVADQGYAAAMFSMEMTGQEMTDRAICNIGRIDLGRYATGKLLDEEWGRLAEAIEQMRDLPLHFDQQPAMTLQEISAKARTLKRKHDIKLLVLDYIQLCGTTSPKASRHHQLEEISRGLKALAASLDIA